MSIVCYGAGNLASVAQAVYLAGGEPRLAETPEEVLRADRLILPGVGAAGPAIARLRRSGMAEALSETVRTRGRPLLGICLGFQLLAERLHEFGEHAGLSWVNGDVISLSEVVETGFPVPHMGWNRVRIRNSAAGFFRGIREGSGFYFAHSYTLRTVDQSVVAAETFYGNVPLVAAAMFDSVFAVQFHPEKSQANGRKLIAAFMDWSP